MNREARANEIKYLLGPILLPVVIFFRELIGLTVFAGFDFTHLILPFQKFARESLYAGELPEWNPYMFGGFPQLAEGEGGFFYPGNVLFLLPGDQGVLLSWTVVLHFILAGCLMYAFLRGRGIRPQTSAWLSVFYQLIPGLILRAETVGLFEAVTWLPGFYWGIERAVMSAVEGRKSGWVMWVMFTSMCVAMMLLAGSSQIAFYGMLGGVFYLGGLCLLGIKTKKLVVWGLVSLGVTAVVAAVLAAVQLIPTSIFSQLSYRVQDAGFEYYRIGTWLNFPRLASLFVFPAISEPEEILHYVTSLGYIGFLPAMLVGIALSLHRKYMNPILAPFMLVFFGVLLAFGLNIALNEDLITYPGFRLFRALGRMILPTVVGFFALAAVGLDRMIDYGVDGSKKAAINKGITGTVIVSVILVVWLVIYEGLPLSGFLTIGLINLGIGAVVVLALLGIYMNAGNRKVLVGVLVAWLVLQVVSIIPLSLAITMSRSGFERVADKLSLGGTVESNDPLRSARVLIGNERDVWDPLLERIGSGVLTPGEELPIPAFGNELTLADIGVVNAYTPLVTDRWHEIAHEYAASGLVLEDVTEASIRLRLILALTGTDALVVPEAFTGGYGFVEAGSDVEGVFPEGWHVLKVPGPHVPYVSIPTYVEAWSESDWEWFKHWIGQRFFEPGDWVSVEIGENADVPAGMEWGQVQTDMEEFDTQLPAWGGISYEFDADRNLATLRSGTGSPEITMRVNSPDACWVVVRESHIPGWRAEIDGAEVTIYTADYLFMGIPVQAGEHTVKLTYRTPGLPEGAWISCAGWLLWIMVMALSVRISRRKMQD